MVKGSKLRPSALVRAQNPDIKRLFSAKHSHATKQCSSSSGSSSCYPFQIRDEYGCVKGNSNTIESLQLQSRRTSLGANQRLCPLLAPASNSSLLNDLCRSLKHPPEPPQCSGVYFAKDVLCSRRQTQRQPPSRQGQTLPTNLMIFMSPEKWQHRGRWQRLLCKASPYACSLRAPT